MPHGDQFELARRDARLPLCEATVLRRKPQPVLRLYGAIFRRHPSGILHRDTCSLSNRGIFHLRFQRGTIRHRFNRAFHRRLHRDTLCDAHAEKAARRRKKRASTAYARFAGASFTATNVAAIATHSTTAATYRRRRLRQEWREGARAQRWQRFPAEADIPACAHAKVNQRGPVVLREHDARYEKGRGGLPSVPARGARAPASLGTAAAVGSVAKDVDVGESADAVKRGGEGERGGKREKKEKKADGQQK